MAKRTWTDKELIEAIKHSNNKREVLKKLNLSSNGSGGYTTITKKIKELNIDISHFNPYKNFKGNKKRRNIEEILIQNSDYLWTSNLKKRLLTEGLIKHQCAECGNEGFWNKQKLSLQIDHKNGDRADNRLENLRLLCPNCHSQTKTFAGRKNKKEINSFCECGNKKNKTSKRCWKCAIYPPQLKKFDVSKEELEKLVWIHPTSKLSKMYGVSDTAIGKRCKRLKIEKPPRGYWAK